MGDVEKSQGEMDRANEKGCFGMQKERRGLNSLAKSTL